MNNLEKAFKVLARCACEMTDFPSDCPDELLEDGVRNIKICIKACLNRLTKLSIDALKIPEK